MGYFLVGLFIGCVIGIFLTAICIAGKTADYRMEQIEHNKEALEE